MAHGRPGKAADSLRGRKQAKDLFDFFSHSTGFCFAMLWNYY